MAVTSSRTRVFVAPHPSLRPPKLTEPELTKSMLEPRFAICCCMVWSAPWPMPTMAITAPTPMMMPSMVNSVRILLRASARKAIRNVERRSIALLFFQDRQGLQHLRGAGLVGDDFIAADFAVAEDDSPPRKLRDVVLVRHQHNRQPLPVQRLQDLHHLHRGAAVQVSRRLVRQEQ